MANYASNAYKQVRRAALVEGASPHKLIRLLLDGAIRQIDVAQKAIVANDMKGKQRALDKALAIVQELQSCLQNPDTVEVAGNMFALYGFVIEQILLANRESSVKPLGPAVQVLQTLNEAWIEIGPEKKAA